MNDFDKIRDDCGIESECDDNLETNKGKNRLPYILLNLRTFILGMLQRMPKLSPAFHHYIIFLPVSS